MSCFDFLPFFWSTTSSSDGGVTTTTSTCYCALCFDHLVFKDLLNLNNKKIEK